MHLFHHYHRNDIGKLIHSPFWLFEVSIWLHVLARSVISVFIPVMLLINGVELRHIMVYYAVFMLIDIPLNFWARALTRWLGARWVIIIGTIGLLLYFSLFYTLNFTPLTLFLMAFLAAWYDAHYYVGHIYLFIESGARQKKNAGSKTSILYIVKQFASLISPLIGAAVLIVSGQQNLILLSIVLFMISLIPLFAMDHIHDVPLEKSKPFTKFFKGWQEKRDYLSWALFGIHGSAEGVLWPLFIYITFESIESVAYLPVIISLTAMLFTFFAGKIRQADRSIFVGVGALLIAITWILRLNFSDDIFYYFTVFLVGLFTVMISVPLDTDLFERAKKVGSLDTAFYKNTISMTSKLFLYGAMVFVLNIFQVTFITAVVALLCLMALNYYFAKKYRKNPIPKNGPAEISGAPLS